MVEHLDENRRKFLKIMLIGGSVFVLGKILSPLFSQVLDKTLTKGSEGASNKPTTFKITEKNKTLTIYDDSGEEVFQIDNS